MKLKHVIVDCDPGIDDMVAIMMLLHNKNVSIDLFVAGAGNSGLEICAKNALDIAHFFNANIDVAKGEKKPIKAKLQKAVSAQGANGLGGYELEASPKSCVETHYDDAMLEVLKKNGKKGTTILVIEPLTSLAMFLKRHEEAKEYIKEVVYMGGTLESVNNFDDVYTEFNVKNDPTALQMVLNSGLNVCIIPMELGHYAFFTLDELDRIATSGLVGQTLSKIFLGYKDGHVKTGIAVHDPCAAAYFINNKITNLSYCYASFKEQTDALMQVGFTLSKEKTNIKIALKINNKKFKKMFFRALKIAEKRKKKLG